MKFNIKKKKDLAKQVKLSLRDKKHQANLRKNGGLYFQIGLVATLFIFFGIFQAKFHKKEVVVNPITITDTTEVITVIPDFIIEENIPKKTSVQVSNTPLVDLSDPTIVDNDESIIETVVDVMPIVVHKAPSVSDITIDDDDPEIDVIPVSLVSDLPVFPGCEMYIDKKAQMDCFSSKVARLISKKFNTDVASDIGVTGKQKIMVTFIVNTKGEVEDVRARAPHPELQKEAIKAVKLLPKMKPAKQGFKTVNVSYSLPIIFNVE